MSFQAYLDAVKAKTGKTPEQLKTEAVKAGVYSAGMKAADLITWLAGQHGLGRARHVGVGGLEVPGLGAGAKIAAKGRAAYERENQIQP